MPLKRRLLPLLVLVALPAIWWLPLLAGRLPDFMDTVTYFYPVRVAAARQLHTGTLPLWLPNTMGGMPLASDPQIGVWYPPMWIYFLMPTALVYTLVIFSHYLIAGFGAWALARRLGSRGAAALFAGFTFAFGSMLVARLALCSHLFSGAWIPWVLWGVEVSLFERARWGPARGTLLTGILLALQIHAGSPQFTYYLLLVLPVYWLLRAGLMDGGRSSLALRLAHAGAQLAQAVILAVLLSAVQLLPTWDFLKQCERAEVTQMTTGRLQTEAISGSQMWRAFVGFTMEGGEDTDTINAIGIGALLLVPLAFLRRKRRRRAIALLVVGAVGFLIALDFMVPFLSKVLPMYGRFHAPRRALILWSCVGPIVASLGAAELQTRLRARRMPRVAYPAALIVLSLGTVWILPRLERAFTTEDRFRPDPRYLAAIGNDRVFGLDPTFLYSHGSRNPDFGLSMMPELSAWFDYHDPQGYNPLVPLRYGRARLMIGRTSNLNLYVSHGIFITDPNSVVLKLMNVQYLVGRHDLYDPARRSPTGKIDTEAIGRKLELVYDHPKWPLYRYRERRPFAWVPGRVRRAEDTDKAIAYAATDADPYGAAFVAEDLTAPDIADPPGIIAAWSNGRTIELSLSRPADQPTLAVISTNWLPGWHAVGANSNKVKILPADGFLVGALLPPGTATMKLVYTPPLFHLGAVLTLAGLVLSAAGFAWPRRR